MGEEEEERVGEGEDTMANQGWSGRGTMRWFGGFGGRSRGLQYEGAWISWLKHSPIFASLETESHISSDSEGGEHLHTLMTWHEEEQECPPEKIIVQFTCIIVIPYPLIP